MTDEKEKEDKKWHLSVNAELDNEEISPELKLGAEFDENQNFEIKISKDKIYAEYKVDF